MKILLSAFLAITLLTSCKKDKGSNEITNCGVQHPLLELDWLADLKEPCLEGEICSIAIFQALYNSETVFYTFPQGPLCDPVFIVTLRDCRGDTVKIYHWEDIEAFEQEVDSVKTLYSCWEK